MELRIINPIMDMELPRVQWNHEELKAEVAAKMNEYASIAYTEDDAKAMKADRAQINKFISAVDEERKRIKRYYMQPCEEFENQVKDVLAPAKQAVNAIGEKLDEIEQRYRNEKTEKMEAYYKLHVGDLAQLIPFQKTIKEEFYKRAFTDKKLEQAYIDFFARIDEDMEALEELPERFRDKAILRYVESFNFSDALREGKRLEEMERAMEERRQQQERSIPNDVSDMETQPNVQMIENYAKQADEDIVSVEEILCLEFRVWGTKEQIMGLKKYLLDNQIKFGKVE